MDPFTASVRALMCGDVACACALSETVFHSRENSWSCCLLYNNHTWHFPVLQPVESSRCFPFQLNPLRPSLLYCIHCPVLWQGPSECQNSLFSITIKQIWGRGVKERKWLPAGKGHGQKKKKSVPLLTQCCIAKLSFFPVSPCLLLRHKVTLL